MDNSFSQVAGMVGIHDKHRLFRGSDDENKDDICCVREEDADDIFNAEPQVLPHEAKARQSSEAKQTYSPMDSIEDW